MVFTPSLKTAFRKTLIAASVLVASTSQADNIYQVYRDAVANDPVIRAAEATLRSEQEGKKAALGALLPQVGLNYSVSDQDRSTNQNDLAFLANSLNQQTQNYTLGLSQKILDLSVWYNFKSAGEISEKAELDFRSNEQDLISRSVESYLSVLRAYDNLESSLAEEAAFKQQLDQTQQRFDVGLVAITDVHESQAAYDLAKVNRLANQGILETAYEGLTLLTGKVYQSVELVSDDLPISDPTPADRKSWVEMAGKGNLDLLSAHFSTKAAEYNYKKAASGHLPTISAEFSHNNSEILGGTLVDPGSGQEITDDDWIDQFGALPENETNTISLKVNVPIYSGGTVSASRRRALAQFDASREQLNGVQRSVIQKTRADHIAVQTSIQTVAARKQAITSSRSALDAIEAGYQVGTRNIVDVLNAQRNLYNSQRDYANARYDYIEAMFELKQSAGLLSAGDIQTLNEFVMIDKPATEQAAIQSIIEENE